MPRRRLPKKREILPDPVYGSVVVAKFINRVMLDGKKSVAEAVVYGAFDKLVERHKKTPIKFESDDQPNDDGSLDQMIDTSDTEGVIEFVLKVFNRALSNVRPMVEVRSRRVGGATYQIPMEVRPARQLSLSMRWIVQSAQSRDGKGMVDKLVSELIDACEGRGGAVTLKRNTHRMADANKAFAHYRW